MSDCLSNYDAEKFIAGQLLKGAISFKDPLVQALPLGAFQDKHHREVVRAVHSEFTYGTPSDGMFSNILAHFKDIAHPVINDLWLMDLEILSFADERIRDIGWSITQLTECYKRRKAKEHLTRLQHNLATKRDPQELRTEIMTATNLMNDIMVNSNWEMDAGLLAEQIVRPPLAEYDWGWENLDDATGGIQAGELHVIGARPGNGKTSFMAALAVKWLDEGKRVLFLSGEFPSFKIGQSIVTNKMGVNIRNRKLRASMTEEQLDDLRNEIKAFQEEEWEGRLTIMDEGDLGSDPFQWFGRINHLKPDIVMYDYIQYLADGPPSKRERIGLLLQEWKSYAKANNIALVFASQLNRDVQSSNRKDPTPNLADLESAGTIEQYACNALLLVNRKALYPGRKFKDGDFQIVLGKSRFGGGGGTILQYNFDGEYCRFNET